MPETYRVRFLNCTEYLFSNYALSIGVVLHCSTNSGAATKSMIPSAPPQGIVFTRRAENPAMGMITKAPA